MQQTFPFLSDNKIILLNKNFFFKSRKALFISVGNTIVYNLIFFDSSLHVIKKVTLYIY